MFQMHNKLILLSTTSNSVPKFVYMCLFPPSVCLRVHVHACTHLLAYTVLVDGPDGWHVGGKQLILCEGGIAGPGTD